MGLTPEQLAELSRDMSVSVLLDHADAMDELRATLAAKTRYKYRTQDKEKIKEINRRYYAENKEKLAERSRRYAEANKEKVAETQRRYREANKEKVAEYRQRYREENKAMDTEGKQAIRILRKSLKLTQKEFAALVGVAKNTISMWENISAPKDWREIVAQYAMEVSHVPLDD